MYMGNVWGYTRGDESGPEIRARNRFLDADCIFEKKIWISTTGLCNNNCIFCLDGERTDRYHKKGRI